MHRSAQVPQPEWNGSKHSGNFARVVNSGLARMTVASPSQIGRMSLGTNVSQSQVTLEISPEWQLLPSHIQM